MESCCSEPIAYQVVITCKACGNQTTFLLCEGHMDDPGPILATHCTCKKEKRS